ncbi:hypothetical protein KC338_g8514 [Hortaea werneckii]|nr:hypothetical protein KC323_g8522 [Hortaea werneckii]KAI6856295.1 hypothetical protein KC338_g8514 [Hortaea werneckii]KAI7345132.1 hypothetical protein KC320_g8470 [Hortaea werneckii]
MPKNENIDGKRIDTDVYRRRLKTLAMYALLAFLASAAQSALGLDSFNPDGNTFGKPGLKASYDYIVVGGGTGGLTIAARLAEDKNVSVAVVEVDGFY